MTEATGYDGLSGRLVPETDLRTFLLGCFELAESELFVCHHDRVAEESWDVAAEVEFAAYCTYWPVSGHFAMGFDVGIKGRLADLVGRREFAERFAARFDTFVLYGDDEPPGLWTVILPGGGRLRAAMDESEDRYELYAVTAPVPGLPELPVREDLWRLV